MCKKLWQILCSVTVAIAIIVTSFLSPVRADSHTTDDLYNVLVSIDQALTAPSSARNADLIYRFTLLKNDFEWLFGSSGSGAGDGHISYVYNNQSYSNMPFNYALGDLISQQNEILMSLVSSYVDASDPNNIVIKPGLFDRLTNIYNAVNSSAVSDAAIASDIDSLLSETNVIRSTLTNIYNLLTELADYQVPQESITAYSLFSRLGGNVLYSDGQVSPYFKISGRSTEINISGTYYLAFYYSGWTAPIASMVTSGGVSANLSYKYEYLVRNSNYHLFVYTISGNGQFTFTVKDDAVNRYVIPIYFGHTTNMNQDMQMLLNVTSETLTTQRIQQVYNLLLDTSKNQSWLKSIYDYLIGDPDSTSQTQSDIDSMNQKVNQLQTSLDGYNDQFEAVQDDVDPSGLLTNIQGYSSQIGNGKSLMQDIYNSFGEIKWLFLLPLMIGLILLFVG